jgi:hypothetical protein
MHDAQMHNYKINNIPTRQNDYETARGNINIQTYQTFVV